MSMFTGWLPQHKGSNNTTPHPQFFNSPNGLFSNMALLAEALAKRCQQWPVLFTGISPLDWNASWHTEI